MPTLTPQITLNALLQTILGTVNAGSLRITLCGFGNGVPSVAGTSILGEIQKDAVANGSGVVTADLYGNDVISPAGTFYCIQTIAANGNVTSSQTYEFEGDEDVELSSQVPIVPGRPSIIGVYVVPIANCSQVLFDGILGTGQSLTLTTSITSSAARNFTAGAVVPFFLKQDATGGRTFAWPANFIDPPAINLTPSGVTTSMWYDGGDGNFYQYGAANFIAPLAASTTRVNAFAAVAPAGIDLGGFNSLLVSGAATVLDALKGRSQSLLLLEDVTVSGANNFATGNLITLGVSQDAEGGWDVTWSSQFQSPPILNMAQFGKTTILWADDEFGNYYQFGVAVWS